MMNNFYSDRFFIKKGQTISWITYTKDSGKIIYRDKIDTLMGVTHPGIILGKNSSGQVMVIHNHYLIGHAEIETLDQFTQGSKHYFDTRKVFYNTKKIIERAIESWKEKKAYSWLTNNCQQYVNRAANGINFSEAVDKGSDTALVIGGLTTLFGLATKSGAAVKVGLSIAGLGVVGKTLNK